MGFYIRFSSFMISHTLIQLDNQREKPTQVLIKWASAVPRTRGCFAPTLEPPRAAVICVPLSPIMKKSQWFGWESRNLPRHATRNPGAPQSPPEHPNFCIPKGTHTPKRAQPHAAPPWPGGHHGSGCSPKDQSLLPAAQGSAAFPAPNSPPDPLRSPLPLYNYCKLLARNC